MRKTFPTKFDEVASVYNKASFERIAHGRGYTPRTWGFLALFPVAMTLLMFVGAAGFFMVAAKQFYLNAYGVETLGKVVEVAYRTNSPTRRAAKWETVSYEFTTAQGERIKAKLDRPVNELTHLPDRNHFMIVYWERFPSVNSPRGVQTNASIVLAPLFLLGFIHCLLWSKRMIEWWTFSRNATRAE